MIKRRTIREWQLMFNDGQFEDGSFNTQVDAGWYDWWCKDDTLVKKTKRMGNIIKKIKQGGKIDLDKHYVWFKNNCPVVGGLYDDFRFSDIETGANQFVVQIGDHREEYRYNVFVPINGFSVPIFSTNYSKELVKWFNTKEE